MKCPECGGDNYDVHTELEYLNQNDPTPMYGGNLTEVTVSDCQDCELVDSPQLATEHAQ